MVDNNDNEKEIMLVWCVGDIGILSEKIMKIKLICFWGKVQWTLIPH